MTRLFDLDMQLIWDVALMAIAVFFLFLFLSKLLFHPVREMLDNRTKKIAGQISDTQKDREDAAELKSVYEAKRKELYKEAEIILKEARQTAQKNAVRIEGEAKAEMVRMLQEANQEAELIKRRMQEEAKQEMVALAAMMAAKAVATSITLAIQEKLVDETLKEVGASTWQS